jgi:AcrR family transcriptional regulator
VPAVRRNPAPAKRAYHSPRRQEQARATRRAILEAARRRFERDGYVVTTMDAIAVEAGVASKTVYSAFTTKAGLLRALWDLLLKGDTDDAPVAQREAYVAVLAESDDRRRLLLNARNGRVVKERVGAMFGVIRDAAVVDADCAALWELIQTDFHANQGVIVAAIDASGGLREDLDVARATDLLWTLNHPDVWHLLVARCGWTPARFEEWLAESSCRQLLGRSAPKGRTPRRRA